ncbi:DUF5808 domain-containing protein [Flavobacterium aciduliphilum]|uniref:DUF5808 domain-containing protein n=1 Tax=Flavobacterium aciduliphilum TaxID=1101402 RepID=A0A328YCF4_9FLAO|nr:DUF5808 domain-containing protein [Flavobacterium aciduliphilum]RAR70215.1 hypothetical protein CLV55_11140 [Flavobacterium aciduliphilum]
MKPSQDLLEQWNKDPNNWKWGVFYFNKEDKRIFPPKRIPWMGWTINFANPISILFFILILSLTLCMIWFIQ